MTTSDASNYRLDDQIGFLLRKANQRHMSICSERISGMLTAVQFSTLYRLASEPEAVSQNALGRMVAMDAATTKGVVSRLKERGLVISRPDQGDKRRHMLSTTQKGADLLAQMLPLMRDISAETLAPLESYEQDMLLALLRKIS